MESARTAQSAAQADWSRRSSAAAYDAMCEWVRSLKAGADRRPVPKRLLDGIKRLAPNVYPVNRIIADQQFRRVHRRGALPVDHRDATINDVIFHTMLSRPWTPLELACVDKVDAKAEAARLCPEVRTAATLAVLDMRSIRGPRELYQRLAPFLGSDVFAKAAHATKGVKLLRHVTSPADLTEVFDRARHHYFWKWRETQYAGMRRRIVVEEAIRARDGGLPDDYKFHCVAGTPALCQINHREGSATHVRLFSLPGFDPFDEEDGVIMPPGFRMASQEERRRMIEMATRLAAPFDYVRIDLYNGADGIFFGEFTFTPGAAVGIAPGVPKPSSASPQHRRYSRFMMDRVRAAAPLR